MGDPINRFSGGSGPKRLSKKEIENMKKNMKKIPEIQLKSDIYHNQEINEADTILDTIHHEEPVIPSSTTTTLPQKETTYGIISYLVSLRKRFISLFD